MPELPIPKLRTHPWQQSQATTASSPAAKASSRYVELATTSNFSFLRGASHPEELVEQAAQLGYRAIAITDRHTLAGIVRAHVAAKEHGIHLIVGSRIELEPSLAAPKTPDPWAAIVHATDLASYSQLCRLLTLGKRRAAKGECQLCVHDLIEHASAHSKGAGLLCTLLPPRVLDGAFVELVEGLRRALGDRLSLGIARLADADDALRTRQLVMLSEWTSVPLAAHNDVHYHVPERRPLQDVLTCIRLGCTLDRAGYALAPNAERVLRAPSAMDALFADLPGAIARAGELADRTSGFSLDQLRYRYPAEVVPVGTTPMEHLRDLARRGALERYPRGLPDKVRLQIEHELRLIEELDYATYFLTVHDIVAFARSRDILCQGRGAAANSAVCYCLGITAVDPNRVDVLFERFVSKERNEPPDIDVDFEHERREEVIQYLYRKYGRDRAALAAEVISYRGRSAIRDVGKALGFSLDCVERLAGGIDWWHDGVIDVSRVREIGLDPHDPTIRRLASLAGEILGFPRHLSQHVGGFVITEGPLCEFVPIENAAMADRTVIEWDKDDIDAMGMLKVDVLGLGMLTCLRKAIHLVNEDAARRATAIAAAEETDAPLLFHTIPAEDPVVYDMICRADTVGVFQIESRAQMSMLPRLRPRLFYDLVIEVAIVRPGPIQGDMVHPYLRRRNGEEPISYPDEKVKAVLGKTLGVPLFQEQAMALAIVAAGFTPGEADQLRRAIAAWKRKGNKLVEFAAKLEQGMIERGYTREFAQQVFRQIQGFSGYGFPESHAASFALLVYISSWLKCHRPAAFAAALINSQPMGFYAPAQIVRDVLEHGVDVRGVDVNASDWDCTLERSDPLALMPNSIATDDLSALFRTARQRPAPTGAKQPLGGWWPLDPSSPTPPEGVLTFSRSGRRGQPRPRERPLRQREREERLRDPSMCLPVPRPSPAEDQPALRLGMRLVRGLSHEEATLLETARREHGQFESIESLWRSSRVRVSTLRRLAAAEAFRSMGLNRQEALWHIKTLRDEALPLFEVTPSASLRSASPPRRGGDEGTCRAELRSSSPPRSGGDVREADRGGAFKGNTRSRLPRVTPLAAVAHDYAAIGLSLKRHPMSCMRERIAALGGVPCAGLNDARLTPHGCLIAVAGLVLVRQRPGTANGIVFMTLEDESGIANLVIRPKIYARYRQAARHGVVVLARGVVERGDGVAHVIARLIEDVSASASVLETKSRDFH